MARSRVSERGKGQVGERLVGDTHSKSTGYDEVTTQSNPTESYSRRLRSRVARRFVFGGLLSLGTIWGELMGVGYCLGFEGCACAGFGLCTPVQSGATNIIF